MRAIFNTHIKQQVEGEASGINKLVQYMVSGNQTCRKGTQNCAERYPKLCQLFLNIHAHTELAGPYA
jgi:hypothetical protein